MLKPGQTKVLLERDDNLGEDNLRSLARGHRTWNMKKCKVFYEGYSSAGNVKISQKCRADTHEQAGREFKEGTAGSATHLEVKYYP